LSPQSNASTAGPGPDDGVGADEFAALWSTSLHMQIVRLNDQMASESQSIRNLSDQLRRTTNALHEHRQLRDALVAAEGAAVERFRTEYRELLALPLVAGVEIVDDVLHVNTAEVAIRHDGDVFTIGTFRIELSLELGIRMINTNNLGDKQGWDHPHVQGGYPCLGNLRIGFEKLLAEFQFVPLVSMILQFLESYTPAEAYCAVERWRKVGAR
jgi:hypothetical protein